MDPKQEHILSSSRRWIKHTPKNEKGHITQFVKREKHGQNL